MGYIGFSLLSLGFLFVNIVADKLNSGDLKTNLIVFIKSSLMCIFSLILVFIFGHQNQLFVFENLTVFLCVIVFCISYVLNWYFFFKAIKIANLDAHSAFNETNCLFVSNIFNVIFLFNTCVNPNSALSIILYILGLVLMLISLLLIVFNKKLNEGYDKKWILYSFICSTVCGFSNALIACFVNSNGVTRISGEVLSFYGTLMVAVVFFFICLFKKDLFLLKKVPFKRYLIVLLGAVTNAIYVIFRYIAYGCEGANPSIANVIITSYFIFIAIYTAIKNKRKFNYIILIVLILVVTAMILMIISPSIT